MDPYTYPSAPARSCTDALGNGPCNAPLLQQYPSPPTHVQQDTLPDWMRKQHDQHAHAARQAELRKLKAQIFNLQGSANLQQSSNLNPNYPPMQQKAIYQSHEGSYQGQTVLEDVFLQSGQAQGDAFQYLQYANQQNAEARAQLQYLPGSHAPQSYLKFEHLFTTNYQNHPGTATTSQQSLPQPNSSRTQQQVARDVSHLQQSPNWINHHRTGSQSMLIDLDSSLSPDLFPIPSAQSPSQNTPMQSHDQRMHRFTSDASGPMKSSNHSYNTTPGPLGGNQLHKQQNTDFARVAADALKNVQNAVGAMSRESQYVEHGTPAASANATSRPNIAPHDSSSRWSQSPQTMHQMNSPSPSPAHMAATQPNLVKVPQPLVHSAATAMNHHRLNSVPQSAPVRSKRRLSEQADSVVPTTQSKKQKLSAPGQQLSQETTSRSRMTVSAPQTPLQFLFPGQRTEVPFRRTFMDPSSSTGSAFYIALDPESIIDPVSQKPATKPAVSSAKKSVTGVSAPKPRKAPAKSGAKATKKTPASTLPRPSNPNTSTTLPAHVSGSTPTSRSSNPNASTILPAYVPGPVPTSRSGNIVAPSSIPSGEKPSSVTGPRASYVFENKRYYLLPIRDPNSIIVPTTYQQGPLTPSLQTTHHSVYESWKSQTVQHTPQTSYTSPYPQYQELPHIPAPQPQRSSETWDEYALSQMQSSRMGPIRPPPIVPPPVRSSSPQPPPPHTHPDNITRTWHPRPCGCCPNGVPSKLIRMGNAFQITAPARELIVEEKLVRYLR